MKVILVGHSVGSYIALELIRKWQEGGMGKGINILGACLLFPTVTHIAKSPSGRKVGVSQLVPKDAPIKELRS